jgi:peptidyl-prolyl cis-trans isomerase SurA
MYLKKPSTRIISKFMNKIIRNITIAVLFCIAALHLSAQPGNPVVVDKIIAIVGDQIVLQSDLEKLMMDLTFPDSNARWEARCEAVKGAIYQKLILNQSYLDSLKVSDDQVDNEMNRRMDYFISQIGSKEKLEEYYGKTITEIKDEMRDPIKEMILAQQMKDKIISRVKISPTEVYDYFKTIPNDSLPYYNTEVEIAQILYYVKPSDVDDKKAKSKLSEIRNRIIAGEKFESLAILYSDDPASATKGGDLGLVNKADLVPEFSAVAFKLKKDSVSDIVKTQYGYHIIKMIDRKGDKVRVKHILIKPVISFEARTSALIELNKIRKKIVSDSISFAEAAQKYSQDENTKNNGGILIETNTGSTRIPVDKLDPSLVFVVDSLKVGTVSQAMKVTFPDGRLAYRLVFVKSKLPPHKANMTDDFSKIKDLAENSKQYEIIQKWIDEKAKNTYITINEPFNNCVDLKKMNSKK